MPDEPKEEPKEEPKDSGPWYGKYNFDDQAKINILSQYKTENDFVEGAIETKKKVGAMFSAPESSDPEYAEKLKKSRIKLGARGTPDEYQTNIPDDLKAYSTDEFLQTAKEQAVKWGLTQAELDEGVKEHLTLAANQADDAKADEDAIAKRKVANRESLEKLWGRRTDDILSKCMDLANHFDTTLFAQDNLNISAEERAEKGGLFAQLMKNQDNPVLWRMAAIMHESSYQKEILQVM